MSKTDFQNGFILGFASGGVVEVVDASTINLINEGLKKNPTNGAFVFKGTGVTDLSVFDFSNTTYFNTAFSNCYALKTAKVNTSKAANVTTMFASCSALETVEMTTLSQISNFDGIFQRCTALKSVSKLDFGKAVATNATRYVFFGCTSLENISFEPNSIKLSLDIPSGKLTSESVVSVINGLATVTTAQTLTLNSAITLTDEQKATINSKGWTLAQ